jgi:hypothetical protein
MKTIVKLTSPAILVVAAFFALNVSTVFAGPGPDGLHPSDLPPCIFDGTCLPELD